MASPTNLGRQVAGQVTAARRGEGGAEVSIQVPALGGQRRGGQVGDVLGQPAGPSPVSTDTSG